jgi:hypothetical protein
MNQELQKIPIVEFGSTPSPRIPAFPTLLVFLLQMWASRGFTNVSMNGGRGGASSKGSRNKVGL